MDFKHNKDNNQIDDNINKYYKENYSCHEKDLGKLIEKINKDFVVKEQELSQKLIEVEDEKNKFLKDLKKVEESYDTILEANNTVFEKLKECKKIVKDY